MNHPKSFGDLLLKCGRFSGLPSYFSFTNILTGLGGSAGPRVGDTWEAALKLYSIRFLAMLDFFLSFSEFSELLQFAQAYLLLRDHSKTAHQGQGLGVKVMGTYYLTKWRTGWLTSSVSNAGCYKQHFKIFLPSLFRACPLKQSIMWFGEMMTS